MFSRLRLLLSRHTGTHTDSAVAPATGEGHGGPGGAADLEGQGWPAAPHRPWPVQPSAARIRAARAWLREFPAPAATYTGEIDELPRQTLAQLARAGWDHCATLDAALRACQEHAESGEMRWQPEG